MADVPASLDSIYQITGLLERRGVPHAFIGGVALNTWGVPRATFDLDLAVAVPANRMEGLLAELRQAGAVVDPVFERGFRDRIAGMEQVHVHLAAGSSLLAVDLFLATTPFLESVLARRVTIDLGRGPIWVCTAADLILFKLVADRGKDRVDVENVVSVQGVPEREYLLRWSEVLRVGPRLASLLRRVG